MSKTLIPFNWFGGKFMHAEWILQRLPASRIFVEVFGGSGIILINRTPSQIEAFNDVNSNVVNFFQVLRNDYDEFVRRVIFTPYSKEEYSKAFNSFNEGDAIERARKFYICTNMSYSGTIARVTGWKISTIVSRTRNGDAISRWVSKVPNLFEIAERLLTVQICNHDYRVVFKKFDSAETLFYCDPPYMHSTRSGHRDYQNEMSEDDHIEFLELANGLKGKVAISGYKSDVYMKHLLNFNFEGAGTKANGMFHNPKCECLWMNYNPNEGRLLL